MPASCFSSPRPPPHGNRTKIPPPHPPPEAPVLPPAQLWATLAPPLQARFRQTLLHLLQEVLHDDLAEWVYERLRRRPMVLPVVVEV